MRHDRAVGAAEGLHPDVAHICSAMSDHARAHIVSILMDGRAHPASAIAGVLNMSSQATRFHLRILEEAHLVAVRKVGRHRYYEIPSPDTASRLEGIFGILTPPECCSEKRRNFDSAFEQARKCYTHLAGALAVEITEALVQSQYIRQVEDDFLLTTHGKALFTSLGISFTQDAGGVVKTKRCIDVTHRRAHVGGPLGSAMLAWMMAKDWFRQSADKRALHISPHGRRELDSLLNLVQPKG